MVSLLLQLSVLYHFIITRASSNKYAADEVAFLDWFENNGGKIKSIGLGNFGEHGRGVLAVSDVKANDEIVTIPMRLMFSADRVRASKDAIDKEIVRLFAEDDDIVLASLLFETFKGASSFYDPYLALLPAYVPSLIHFSTASLVELQDPELEKDARTMQTEARTGYLRFVNGVSTKWPKEAVDSTTFDKYLWGLSIINSRGLRFRGKVHLAPLADMFNYAPHNESRRAAGGEFFLLHHKLDAGTKQLTLTADRDQPAGTQLQEDYGDNTDKIYLQYHGFVADINPFRCVKVLAPVPARAGKAAGDDPLLAKLFDALQLSVPQYPVTTPSACIDTSGDLGRTLVVYLTVLSFDDDEVQSCLSVFERAKKNTASYWSTVMEECGLNRMMDAVKDALATSAFASLPSDSETATVSPTVHRLLRSIQKWITDSIPNFPTSIEEDEQQLRDIDDEFKDEQMVNEALHKQLALKYRMHAKRLWFSICRLYGIDYLAVMNMRRAGGLGQQQHQLALAEEEFVSLYDDNSTSLTEKVALFNDWFRQSSPAVCKIEASVMPLVRIGTIALADITSGDRYLSVPQSVILDEYTALSDMDFRPLLRALRGAYKGRDDLHELLFFLLHERLVRHKESKFWPYLRLLPTPQEMDVPTMWSLDDIRSRLKPSFVANAIEIQKSVIESTYQMIAKVKEPQMFFPPGLLSFTNYRWASVILDSRSIWWEGKRHLVPMLDFVNCVEGPDPSKVHSTSLQESMLSGFTESYAVTKAAWDFPVGKQLFENYGQPNHIYFTYHGFSLEDGANSHDCVYLEFSLAHDEVKAIDWNSAVAKTVAQEIRMRSQDRFQTCMDTKIGRNIWLFLALKHNRIADISTTTKKDLQLQLLKVPTAADEAFLLQFIEERIAGYEQHLSDTASPTHEPSRAFLQTEHTILKAIRRTLAPSDNLSTTSDDEL